MRRDSFLVLPSSSTQVENAVDTSKNDARSQRHAPVVASTATPQADHPCQGRAEDLSEIIVDYLCLTWLAGMINLIIGWSTCKRTSEDEWSSVCNAEFEVELDTNNRHGPMPASMNHTS